MTQDGRIRVLMIISGLSLGGAEGNLLKLVERIDPERFLPIVVSLSGAGLLAHEIRNTGVLLHELRMERRFLASMRKLLQISRQVRPDVIHGWMYHGNAAASLAAMFLRPTPAVVHGIRASPLAPGEAKRLTRFLLKFGGPLSHLASRVLYNAHSAANAHEAQYQYCRTRRQVISNGFDTDAFRPAPLSALSVRDELGIAPTAQLVGLMGRYHPMKDHENFFLAAREVSKALPNAHFLLAGEGLTNENKSLAELIARSMLGARVHLLGPRRDMPRLLASLDVLASASAYGEAFPNVIGEAMSCGVVCVATSVGDSAAIIGDTGYVVPPRDPNELAARLKVALALSSDERRLRGEAARTRIVKMYSLTGCVEDHMQLYQSLAQKRQY